MAKVLLSVDEALLRRIDRAARARGLSRSAYLAQLAARDLEVPLGAGASVLARGALQQLDRLFSAAPAGEATTEIRAEREARS